MIEIRPAHERGNTRLDWLDSHHTFSFGQYYDPRHMGVANLRVINDDTVIAGGGFATHGHQNMEIVSYVLQGALAHKDSMGNGSIIRPNQVQRMSAGTGVQHSEYNASQTEPVHFLQIWLQPNRMDVDPGYEEKYFAPDERRGRLVLLVSPDGTDGSIRAHQDARLYGGLLGDGDTVSHLAHGHGAYLHVASGNLSVNGFTLVGGDGAAISDVDRIQLEGRKKGAEVLLFDLP